jgi:hypothetical protein
MVSECTVVRAAASELVSLELLSCNEIHTGFRNVAEVAAGAAVETEGARDNKHHPLESEYKGHENTGIMYAGMHRPSLHEAGDFKAFRAKNP